MFNEITKNWGSALRHSNCSSPLLNFNRTHESFFSRRSALRNRIKGLLTLKNDTQMSSTSSWMSAGRSPARQKKAGIWIIDKKQHHRRPPGLLNHLKNAGSVFQYSSVSATSVTLISRLNKIFSLSCGWCWSAKMICCNPATSPLWIQSLWMFITGGFLSSSAKPWTIHRTWIKKVHFLEQSREGFPVILAVFLKVFKQYLF